MVQTLKNTVLQFRDDKRLRYLAVGGLNTGVGYFVSLFLYYSLNRSLHIIYIGLIASVVCISFSFLTYKMLVFQTTGNWLREYFRCYLVYGAATVLGIVLLWLLVDVWKMPFWLAQALIMTSTVFFSYIGHSRFSFVAKAEQASVTKRGNPNA